MESVENEVGMFDRRFYVRDHPGAEPAIILMHGFPDNVHLYDRLSPYLSPPRRVVLFDFLGWGSSDKPSGYPSRSRCPGQKRAGSPAAGAAENRPRDCREHLPRLFWRDRRTIGKTRIPARWRIFLPGHPPVHPHQCGAQQWVVIDRIERLLAAGAVDRVGVGQWQGAGGMLRTGEVVKARAGGQRDVPRFLRASRRILDS